MKKTTKPKVTITFLTKQNKILQKDLIEALENNRKLELEVKKYQDGLAKLEVLNKELKEGVDTLLKEYNDLEKNYINQSTTLIMIEGILTYGYNFFTAYSTLNEVKSILNSK